MSEPRSSRLMKGLTELLVIVAGVMIALAADRCVQAIDIADLEREYLGRLAADLRQDSTLLDEFSQTAHVNYDRAAAVLRAIREGLDRDQDHSEILTSVDWIHYGGAPDYARETWEELLSTGNLAVISDVGLRQRLSVYYNRTATWTRIEQTYSREFDQYRNASVRAQTPELRLRAAGLFARAQFDAGNLPADPGMPAGPTIEPSRADVEAVLDRLRADPDAETGLSHIMPINYAREWYLTHLLWDVSDLLVLVDAQR